MKLIFEQKNNREDEDVFVGLAADVVEAQRMVNAHICCYSSSQFWAYDVEVGCTGLVGGTEMTKEIRR